MRFHRSRVNFINYVMPIGVTQTIRFKSGVIPEVYTPFNSAPAMSSVSDGVCTVRLSEKTSFLLLRLKKQRNV